MTKQKHYNTYTAFALSFPHHSTSLSDAASLWMLGGGGCCTPQLKEEIEKKGKFNTEGDSRGHEKGPWVWRGAGRGRRTYRAAHVVPQPLDARVAARRAAHEHPRVGERRRRLLHDVGEKHT